MLFYCSECGTLTRSLVDRSVDSMYREEDYMYGLREGVHLFRRRRVCQACESSFNTVEVHEDYIEDFFRLRKENLNLLERINTGLQTVSDLSNYLMLLNSREIVKQKLCYKLQSLNVDRCKYVRNELGEEDLQLEKLLEKGFSLIFYIIRERLRRERLRFSTKWDEESKSRSEKAMETLWGIMSGQFGDDWFKKMGEREAWPEWKIGIEEKLFRKLISTIIEKWPLDKDVVLFEGLFFKEVISVVVPYIKTRSLDVEKLQSSQLDDVVLVEKFLVEDLSVEDLSEEMREIMDLFAEHKRLDKKIGKLSKGVGKLLESLTAFFTKVGDVQ